MKLKNGTVENEEIVIDDRLIFNVIGPEIVLKNCVIQSKVPTSALGIRGTLEDTTIVAKKPLNGFYWYDVSLIRCKFVGKFHNNRFGSRNGSSGLVEQCDFSQADIDGAVFYSGSVEKHIFPKWPFLVVFVTEDNILQLEKSALKDENVEDVLEHIKVLHKERKAICYDARKMAKIFNVSLDDIKRSFSGFDFIKF
ncbi:hypothetical protein [Thaumasiovibrio subtropicus]|uniref:hypothetical protein n=1 Tax=Thaumasiovibrio subtropicus TaxID=1891207 RepID=UPI000B35F56B|nr:hypothetical protein [Thaumasiovibrio subtropicus]